MLLLILVLIALAINKHPTIRIGLVICLIYLLITTCRVYMTMDKRILYKDQSQLYQTQITVEPNSKFILWAKNPIMINEGIASGGICSLKLESDNNGMCPVNIVKSSIEDIYIENVVVYVKYIYDNGSTSATEPIRLIYYESELQGEHFDDNDESDHGNLEHVPEDPHKLVQKSGNVLKPNMTLEFTETNSDSEHFGEFKADHTNMGPNTHMLNDRNFALTDDRKPTYSGDDILSDYSNDDQYTN
jgi:hypothetical protein